jgi:uncharacterized repeat protein (TIGR01451 family)
VRETDSGGADGPATVTPASVIVGDGTTVSVTATNRFSGSPGLTITKELKYWAERTATWAIHVANTGTAASTDPIVFTDELPTELTYLSYSGVGWTCTAAARAVTCTHPAALPAATATDVDLVTQVAAGASGEVVNTVTMVTSVGKLTAHANIPGQSSCGSDGAGSDRSDCSGWGPAVPLTVKAKAASTKVPRSKWTQLVSSASTSKKATLSNSTICRDSHGKRISGCAAKVGRHNSVRVKIGKCAVRKVTITIKATPKSAYQDKYRMTFWTRTYRVKPCN